PPKKVLCDPLHPGPQRLVLLAVAFSLGAGGGELVLEAVDPARSVHSAAHVPAQAPGDAAFGAPLQYVRHGWHLRCRHRGLPWPSQSHAFLARAMMCSIARR